MVLLCSNVKSSKVISLRGRYGPHGPMHARTVPAIPFLINQPTATVTAEPPFWNLFFFFFLFRNNLNPISLPFILIQNVGLTRCSCRLWLKTQNTQENEETQALRYKPYKHVCVCFCFAFGILIEIIFVLRLAYQQRLFSLNCFIFTRHNNKIVTFSQTINLVEKIM